MGQLDAYATAEEYQTLLNQPATVALDLLQAQMVGVCRLLERSLQVAPGAFNDHTATFVFDGTGLPLLRLRDQDGRQHFLRTINADGLGIDLAQDGTFDDYALDFADAWVKGWPENAGAQGEPYRGVQLRRLQTATIVTFPRLVGCVQIAGTWGFATVPDTIKQLVIHRTQELRQGLKGGAFEKLPDFEGGVPMQPQTFWYWREAERLYGSRIPGFA